MPRKKPRIEIIRRTPLDEVNDEVDYIKAEISAREIAEKEREIDSQLRKNLASLRKSQIPKQRSQTKINPYPLPIDPKPLPLLPSRSYYPPHQQNPYRQNPSEPKKDDSNNSNQMPNSRNHNYGLYILIGIAIIMITILAIFLIYTLNQQPEEPPVLTCGNMQVDGNNISCICEAPDSIDQICNPSFNSSTILNFPEENNS